MKKNLIKLCENQEYIFYYKKQQKHNIFLRAEKHKSRIWKLEKIPFSELLEEVKFIAISQ
jgi:hypothetical protein